MRRVISGIILFILLMNTLAFRIEPIKTEWTGTVFIRADGSVYPPDAPVITYDETTYFLTGNITSDGNGIVILRDNILLDGSGYAVKGYSINASSLIAGILLSGRSNVTIKNIIVKGFAEGIHCDNCNSITIAESSIVNNKVRGILTFKSSNISIYGNKVINSHYGIEILASLKNEVYRNYIANISIVGIELASWSTNISTNNNIYENYILNCSYGIEIQASNHNSISKNTFDNSGMFVRAYGNIVENNTVNGKPLVYLENVSDYVIKDAGQVILVGCNHYKN